MFKLNGRGKDPGWGNIRGENMFKLNGGGKVREGNIRGECRGGNVQGEFRGGEYPDTIDRIQ